MAPIPIPGISACEHGRIRYSSRDWNNTWNPGYRSRSGPAAPQIFSAAGNPGTDHPAMFCTRFGNVLRCSVGEPAEIHTRLPSGLRSAAEMEKYDAKPSRASLGIPNECLLARGHGQILGPSGIAFPRLFAERPPENRMYGEPGSSHEDGSPPLKKRGEAKQMRTACLEISSKIPSRVSPAPRFRFRQRISGQIPAGRHGGRGKRCSPSVYGLQGKARIGPISETCDNPFSDSSVSSHE